MSELGDLLELLHGARARVSTVRATVRTWRDEAGFARALDRGGVGTSYAPLESGPDEFESRSRVWLAPRRAREEHEGSDGTRLAVQRGRDWWRYDDVNGALSNENDPDTDAGIGEALRPLLDPSAVLGFFDFERLQPGERAGRETIRLRAVPREQLDRGRVALSLGVSGADDVLLDVDAARGTLLRVEAQLGGEPFSIVEVVEIAFDESFPEETFEFTPPPGVPVRSTLDHMPVRFGLTVEQAAAAAPFVVWVPGDDWDDVEVVYAREEQEPPVAPQVHLHYGPAGLRIVESPAGHPGEPAGIELAGAGPWRESERDGRRIEVREHAEYRLPSQVRLELEGTRIVIHSTVYGHDALADIAVGLKRAP